MLSIRSSIERTFARRASEWPLEDEVSLLGIKFVRLTPASSCVSRLAFGFHLRRFFCPDLFKHIQAAVDIPKRQSAEIGQIEFPPFYPHQALDRGLRKAQSLDDRGAAGDH